jgi:hypothetical protein
VYQATVWDRNIVPPFAVTLGEAQGPWRGSSRTQFFYSGRPAEIVSLSTA